LADPNTYEYQYARPTYFNDPYGDPVATNELVKYQEGIAIPRSMVNNAIKSFLDVAYYTQMNGINQASNWLIGKAPSGVGINLGGVAGFTGPIGGFHLGGGGIQVHYIPGTYELAVAPYWVPPSIAWGVPAIQSFSPRGFSEMFSCPRGKPWAMGFGPSAALDLSLVLDYNVTRAADLGGQSLGAELSAIVPTKVGGIGGHLGYVESTSSSVWQVYGGPSYGLPGVDLTSQAPYTFGPWAINVADALTVLATPVAQAMSNAAAGGKLIARTMVPPFRLM
jgi:hypothetical protein